eukprot:COSAG01_NODE_35186_length_535_cov_3.261468_1_plen_51_part_10
MAPSTVAVVAAWPQHSTICSCLIRIHDRKLWGREADAVVEPLSQGRCGSEQ